jgi:hypothetical protein
MAKYERDHVQPTNIRIEDWDGNLTISAIYATQLKRNNTMLSLTH